jgi:UDP-N-acetylglucosamine 4-epimerase
VTGVAGFIGSHLLETLLQLNQQVVGLDNFATGFRRNLEDVQASVDARQWSGFRFLEGDIRNPQDCRKACENVDFVLHQAALGSVPRSLADPVATHDVNVTGFLHMLEAARQAKVKSFVFAASSSTYGDHPGLPKIEDVIGRPLSPYAVTKYANELYAEVFARCYGFQTIGLRYFNVFGRRQDPDGVYAAVIPKWIGALIRGEPVVIHGDGETSRDFCHVANAVQANLLAAMTESSNAMNQVYNVSVGASSSLVTLLELLCEGFGAYGIDRPFRPVHGDFRAGDVRHSQADIGKARRLLGYMPAYSVTQGLAETLPWYLARSGFAQGA